MALEWLFRPLRRSAAYNGRAGAYPSPQQLHMKPPAPNDRDYAPQRYREPRMVHREDLPSPQITMADYETAARQIEEAADRALAFNKQVHAYCYEIAQQMRVKGQTVAEELMRARRMSEKVAQGTADLVQFCLDHDANRPEEPAEAISPATPQDIPAEPENAPTAEKRAPDEAPVTPISEQSREDYPTR